MVVSENRESSQRTFASEIVRRLNGAYGRPDWTRTRTPLEELVVTILSQHTSDTNCERAFASLRTRFLRWDDVAQASDEEIADAIRAGGLANVKAPRIKMVVRQVLETNALDSLDSLPLNEAKSVMRSLPGVGPKTAACVLLFACNRPALPVDTHVFRVSHRLGLIDERIGPESAHDILEAQLAPNDVYAFHVNMINHGRAICRARSPRCDDCMLRDLCQFASDAAHVGAC
ncbi:MAG TPA: endonuclease III [Nitrolancea sp.]|nr:endonuclease III [Nitrolancea sp.]